ncbi:MAG: glycosyltransferase [Oscillatoria sp. PMC 1051.18]|nr:glycosyltransferase [Oscillatoria sp. PMC 1050.18]MEC5028658.1 glycosyltransferase [Oscillatoria sp. PMC 1051.18]
MAKYYVFYLGDVLPQPKAHLVQVSHSANAAANLGYPAVLVSLQKDFRSLNPLNLIAPFRPRKPELKLLEFYHLQSRLKVAPLPMPYPIDRIRGKLTDSNTIACKYYLPVHLKPKTQIVHSRDWNFVKAAVKNEIPAIYECHHYENKKYEPEIVNKRFLQVAVTVADTVRENLIRNGMPPEKTVKLHNGFNQLFYERHPEAARTWRQQLLTEKRDRLVVYAGALHTFKGIDLLIEVASQLPNVQFALAGGPEKERQAYQEIIQSKQLENVALVGYLPQKNLASLLQAADLLVYPHLSGEAANFTSPLKLFDYIAAGKPIVSTTIPSLDDFRSSPLIAGWCEPDSATELAGCLKRVFCAYPQWSPDHIHDRALVEQYSWENRISRILDFVDPSFRPQKVI